MLTQVVQPGLRCCWTALSGVFSSTPPSFNTCLKFWEVLHAEFPAEIKGPEHLCAQQLCKSRCCWIHAVSVVSVQADEWQGNLMPVL